MTRSMQTHEKNNAVLPRQPLIAYAKERKPCLRDGAVSTRTALNHLAGWLCNLSQSMQTHEKAVLYGRANL